MEEYVTVSVVVREHDGRCHVGEIWYDGGLPHLGSEPLRPTSYEVPIRGWDGLDGEAIELEGEGSAWTVLLPVRVSTAGQIARRYGYDGQQLEDAYGVPLYDACSARCDSVEHYNGVVVYCFHDGSALAVTTSGRWDLGWPGCYCWRGEGHHCDDGDY